MDTHRYKVGKAQGYAQDTVLKLTDKQAKEKGLTEADRVDLTTTADDSKKANRYDEAMGRQDQMRAAEAAAIAEKTDGAEPEAADADAANKKRGSRS